MVRTWMPWPAWHAQLHQVCSWVCWSCPPWWRCAERVCVRAAVTKRKLTLRSMAKTLRMNGNYGKNATLKTEWDTKSQATTTLLGLQKCVQLSLPINATVLVIGTYYFLKNTAIYRTVPLWPIESLKQKKISKSIRDLFRHVCVSWQLSR